MASAAALLGWPRGNLSRLLYGDSKPSVDTAQEIETTLGVPVGRWADPPSVPFVPPAARGVDEDEEGAA